MVKVDHSDYMIIQVDKEKLYQLKQICICNFLITRLILFVIWKHALFYILSVKFLGPKYSHMSLPQNAPTLRSEEIQCMAEFTGYKKDFKRSEFQS